MRLRDTPNAGGSSVWSEICSFEVLRTLFGATLPERLGPRRAVTIALGSLGLGLSVLAIPIVLFARFAGTKLLLTLFGRGLDLPRHTATILTWGGLRGGISVALALSIPPDFPARDLILTVTYLVVAFSILGQGLTIGPLIRRLQSA